MWNGYSGSRWYCTYPRTWKCDAGRAVRVLICIGVVLNPEEDNVVAFLGGPYRINEGDTAKTTEE